VHFVVEDDGLGIPPDSQNLIFESFRQASEGRNRSHEGAGLGLAIVDACATLMGGSVAVQSTVGKGSRFTVQLPLADASPAPAQSTPAESLSGGE
jgi:signal transduction histidine kinase